MSTSTSINFDRYAFEDRPGPTVEAQAALRSTDEGDFPYVMVTLHLGRNTVTFGIHRQDTAGAVAQSLLKVAEFLEDNAGKLGRP